ncbi:hypothetical protein BC828DRAFT_418058 [Blastocladiella britannica]|nr:hypothetical protein BC828DRAFT_418058 [Blastocladiella britannica]
MDDASRNGHVDVLEWWRNSGLELKYTRQAMDDASCNGHVDVLEWWRHSGLELKYTHQAMDQASNKGHINVLSWWQQGGSWIMTLRPPSGAAASASGRRGTSPGGGDGGAVTICDASAALRESAPAHLTTEQLFCIVADQVACGVESFTALQAECNTTKARADQLQTNLDSALRTQEAAAATATATANTTSADDLHPLSKITFAKSDIFDGKGVYPFVARMRSAAEASSTANPKLL